VAQAAFGPGQRHTVHQGSWTHSNFVHGGFLLRDFSAVGGPLFSGALAMSASGPAAGSTLAFLELLLCPANSPLPGHELLGIFNPANEFVTRERRDVHPRIKGRGIGNQRLAQVPRQLVYRPAGNPRTHRVTVPGRSEHCHHSLDI